MRAFGRLFKDAASSAPRPIINRQTFCRAGLALALLSLFVVSSPRSAQADAVDTAVDAVVIVGSAAGVPVPREAAGIVKELVRCAVVGKSAAECARESVIKTVLKNVPEEGQQFASCVASGRNVAACGTDEILKKIPAQARPMAQCLIGGGNVADCAQKQVVGEIIARAPEEARPLVQCVAEGGNAGDCVTKFAADKLPPEAKPLVDCIARGTAVADCATQFGVHQIDEATKKETQVVLGHLKELKADAEDAMAELPPAVRNIMMLVDGIENGDWDKILLGGGPIVAKMVITTIINVVLTPAFAPIVGPVVDIMVQNRVDLIVDMLKAIKEGDVVLVGEIIFQFYLTMMVEGACALIPDGAFKDATCGNLAKAIAAIAGAAGDVVDAILDVAGAILKGVGMVVEGFVGFIGDVIDDIFGDGLEDPEACGPANAFFANNYMTCMGAAAGNFNAQKIAGDLNGACDRQFRKCHGGRTARLFCTPMGSAFNDQVSKINAALADGANTITAAALPAYLSQRKPQLCRFGYAGRIDTEINSFLMVECTDTLRKAVPLPVNACKFNPPSMTRSRGHSAACEKGLGAEAARAEMNRTCEAHCRDNPEDCQPPPACTDPMTGRTFSYTGPFADQMTCPTQGPVAQVKFNWDDLFNNKDKPVPQILVNDPGRLDLGRGDVGNFVVDGGGGGRVTLNDAMPRDRFVTGKCKLRATAPNLVMYVDQAPHTGAGRLSLKTMQFVSFSGFNDCGPVVANLPTGTGSGGPYLSNNSDGKKKKLGKKPGNDPIASPGGSGGPYPSYFQPDKPPLIGRSPEDIAGGATAGGTALGGVSGNQGYVAPGGGYRPPTVLCMTCGPKGSAKPTNTGSGGPSLAYPNPSPKPGPTVSPKPGPTASPKPGPIESPKPTPSAPRGPDPNIDYGGAPSRPGTLVR